MSKPLRALTWDGKAVHLIDQRLLPFKEVRLKCGNVERVARGIEEMAVRGAPAIGITAAYGIALAGRKARKASPQVFEKVVSRALARLRKTRPTAVNLFWALERMRRVLKETRGLESPLRAGILEKEAREIHREDEILCNRMGEAGARLLVRCRNVLTHCNTGALATGGEGTALAAILHAARKNPNLHVWVDETRPYLQGARLTAFELDHAGVPYHILTDNMAASLMSAGRVDAVITGADRIAANGDTANKIGTYSLAVLARAHRIPFYVAAPTSTFDLSLPHGGRIPIEQRDPAEVTTPRGLPLTRKDFPATNPSFDVTPGRLLTAIICETGVCRPPYGPALRRALGENRK